MVHCWYVEDPEEKELSMDELKLITGVENFKLDANNYKDKVELIAQERHYSWFDTVEVSPETMKDFEMKTEIFSTEHFHGDEEVRFVLEGKGYFDVRDKEDKWIRIAVEKGDFLILPPGIFHRFSFRDQEKYIKFMRLFLDKAPYRINFRETRQSIEMVV